MKVKNMVKKLGEKCKVKKCGASHFVEIALAILISVVLCGGVLKATNTTLDQVYGGMTDKITQILSSFTIS